MEVVPVDIIADCVLSVQEASHTYVAHCIHHMPISYYFHLQSMATPIVRRRNNNGRSDDLYHVTHNDRRLPRNSERVAKTQGIRNLESRRRQKVRVNIPIPCQNFTVVCVVQKEKEEPSTGSR